MKGLLNYIDSFLGKVFKRIEDSSWVGTQSLAYFRILIGIFLIAHYLPEWSWLGDAPQALFNPHMFTMAYFSDGFMPKSFYIGLDLLNLVFFCLLALGIYSRFSLFVLFIINYTGYSYEFGFGKIDHEIHLYLISLLALAFTNCGTKSAFRPDKPWRPEIQKWALMLMCIYIAFGFFTAGLPKFIKWVDFDLSQIGILEWFYKGYFIYDRVYLLADTVFKTPYFVFEFLDYLAPTMELLSFVFLLWGRKAWRIYLILISAFHMGNMLILNIEFILNTICYGIFLVAPFLSHIRKYLPKGPQAKKLLLSTVVILALIQIGRKFYYSDYVYYHGFFAERFQTENYLSVFFWLVTITIGTITVRKKLYMIRD